ncbi:hypothetical protein AVEN_61911-1 [Araneus ventricosus]|uniref:Uncharacterized protein n=1 Tax=Araneus ventricosus TaxID=182803 RepID=A0A4Y2T1I0_ARAVE|nr:hypothetical protein AVEN_267012-1 [Araneus ventricosus]GBN93282.1 hypothetical protein AVEN_61911-1 [Araneus ventricosus]
MSNEAAANGSSSEGELDDLDCLNFPGDVDWSSTLVLRCDPKGAPYNMSDVVNALFHVVRRNEVFNLGPTFLNHAYTLSFKTTFAMENFVKFTRNPRFKGIKVKGQTCSLVRVPSKCVTVKVRNIPLEVDSVHIVSILKQYGTVVKTELIKSNFRGWFHVYTNERKFDLFLKSNVQVSDLPYGIEVKGLYGGVSVEERNPKCLECFYSGHKGDVCEYPGCILYKSK